VKAVFLGEGSSDQPLAGIVTLLFQRRGLELRMSAPDLDTLRGVGRSVADKVAAVQKLTSERIDLFVIHRDSDSSEPQLRYSEIESAMARAAPDVALLAVVPIRMTEAWLLLDEEAIRRVSGNPKGRQSLNLPKSSEAERTSNPKSLLQDSLLVASEDKGRRRDRTSRRFSEHRRHLLESLDLDGPVCGLESYQHMLKDIDALVERLGSNM